MSSGLARPSRVLHDLAQAKWFWPLVALLLLLLFNWQFTPRFFELTVKEGHLYGYLVDVLNRAAPTMLVALGMTLVIATKGVDLSVGAIVAIGGALAAHLVTTGTTNIAVVVAITLAVCCVLGAWNGLLVSVFNIQPMVATLILMVSGRGIAQLITDGQIVTFKDAGIAFIGTGYLFMLPFSVTLVAIMFAVTALLTRSTAMGLFVESVGDNETASGYAGIRVRRVKMMVYIFCGLCAGVASLIVVSNISGADANNAGLNFELDAILAVVIGGTSMSGGRYYLVGSILGALIIQTLTTTILALDVPMQETLVVKAVAVLAVCLLQSREFRAGLTFRGLLRAFGAPIRAIQRRLMPKPAPAPGSPGLAVMTPAAAPAAVAATQRRRRLVPKVSRTHIPMLAGLSVLVLFCAASAAVFPGFRRLLVYQNLINDNAYLGLAAIGMTYVILSGGIDLSVGAVLAFVTVMIQAMVASGVPAPAAILAALAAGTAFGAFMGWIVAAFNLPPFLVTLAGMFLARGGAYVVSLQSATIHSGFYESVAQGNRWMERHLHLGICAAIFLLVLAVSIYVLHWRPFGRAVYAIGGGESSALLMGLPVRRLKIQVYAVSGLCAALAGVVHTFYMGQGDPNSTIGLELDAIAAVVIGGTLLTGGVGYMAGTFVGVLILGAIQTIVGFVGTLNSWWTKIAIGVLLLMFILLQKVVQVKEKPE